MTSWIAIGFLILAGLLLVFYHDAGTIAGFDPADFASLMAATALLIYLSGYIYTSYRGRIGRAVKDIIVWAGLCLVLIAGYSYRTELTDIAYRVAGELSPPGREMSVDTRPGETNAIRIRREPDGHFIVNTNVDGRQVNMIVDTGASTVVLRHEDAMRLGLNTNSLIYSVRVRTANGTAMSARTTIGEISIGPVRMRNVTALVATPGALHQSLLGMSFLSRLRSYEFSGDFLTLRI